ncbi:hypothetical protein [Buttiauxella agrestis]|uniref:hypothetical protein n=1 Tax=Buttiauxella agrestis TaxID=82977 RepID=UPI003975B4CB
MILYHGSRAKFDCFNTAFIGTGEGTQLQAFWFTDNFEGAANHAWMISRSNRHIPSVYTCEFPDHLPIVSLGIPLSEQPQILVLLRDNLPVPLSLSLQPNNSRWEWELKSAFNEMANRPPEDHDLTELLFTRCGIAGAHHWQGDCRYSRYQGRCTVIFSGAAQHIGISRVDDLRHKRANNIVLS